MYIIKIVDGREDYVNAWDNSSSKSERVALMATPTASGIATLAKDVDEFNVLMSALGHEDFAAMVDALKEVTLEQMWQIAPMKHISPATVEELIFDRAYEKWVKAKLEEARRKRYVAVQNSILDKIRKPGEAFQLVASLYPGNDLSQGFFDNMVSENKKAYLSLSKSVHLEDASIFSDEHIQLMAEASVAANALVNHPDFVDQSLENEYMKWFNENSRIADVHEQGEDDYDEEHSEFHDVLVQRFDIPTNGGVVVISESFDRHYYAD